MNACRQRIANVFPIAYYHFSHPDNMYHCFLAIFSIIIMYRLPFVTLEVDLFFVTLVQISFLLPFNTKHFHTIKLLTFS